MITMLFWIRNSINTLNRCMGAFASLLILLAVIFSCGNALSRYLFNWGSNTFLELQWYLFAGVFLCASGYTYLMNQHVRLDLITSRLSPRTVAKIEIYGIVFFLLPIFSIILWVSIAPAIEAWRIWEASPNPGGLPRAPIKTLIPIGMLLLLLQGIAQLCTQILFLRGALTSTHHCASTTRQ